MEISKEEFTIFTVKEHTQTELIEKKSKFIANIYPIASKEEAEESGRHFCGFIYITSGKVEWEE